MEHAPASAGSTPATRSRDSVPVLVVLLGSARDFVIALAVLGVTLSIAMISAYLLYG